MKQADQGTGLRVDSRKIRALAQVATMAGKREIVLRLTAAVLLGDNVLDMKREAAMLLFQSAILTTVLSTLPHQFP